MGELIGLIIFGAVIGALARLVIPGKQAMGWII
ncbi:GlsB/YeaQ/YmgE family stress response membrane protein, partial [Mycobacterium sp. ITM-2017-0098]